jgi:hypothetical protein
VCNTDHVEEFKKQLTREVMIMTGEVGRLQKERQALEQQIGDLFTFYAKQKSLTAGLVRVVQGGAIAIADHYLQLTMSGQQALPGPPQAPSG